MFIGHSNVPNHVFFSFFSLLQTEKIRPFCAREFPLAVATANLSLTTYMWFRKISEH